jgi:DNA-binding XRE family transcriptional regulator
MKSDLLKPEHRTVNPEYRTVKGKRVVVLPEADFEELLRRADLWEPEMPEPDERGLYPLSALAVIQARDILRTRRRLGLSQAELARRAGIRPETLNRIEQGRNKPSVPTIAKIDRALQETEAECNR